MWNGEPERVFAWIPVKVNGHWVWLSWYELPLNLWEYHEGVKAQIDSMHGLVLKEIKPIPKTKVK